MNARTRTFWLALPLVVAAVFIAFGFVCLAVGAK